MKTIYKTGLAILTMAMLFTSCGDDDSGSTSDDDNTPTGPYVMAKVDGVQFETVEYQGLYSVYASRTGTGDNTNIIVGGNDMEMNGIAFTAHGVTTTGTYPLNQEFDNVVMLYTHGPSETTFDTNECDSASGNLVITYIDDEKIEGTFEFVGAEEENCSQTRTITQGSFRGIFRDQ